MIEASVWFSLWIAHAFLRLDRLVQAVGPAAARHQAAGELVDDDRPRRPARRSAGRGGYSACARSAAYRWCISVMLAGVVQAAPSRQQAQLGQELLGVLVAVFGQEHLVRLLVDRSSRRARCALPSGSSPICRSAAARMRLIAHVQVGVVLGLAGDDQRRARLVDQDRVDLVDDGVVEAALHAVAARRTTMLSRR